MDDLTVLHLSDLHVDDTGIRKNLLLNNLLIDIENEMQYSNNIIIVVTGDLVNKANYKNKKEIIEFFKKLRDVLDEKVKHIYIVPGNHDKVRSEIDEAILFSMEKDISMADELKWRYFRVAFEEYNNLVKDIYRIFYPSNKIAERVFNDTYGVHIDPINGKNICVIQFNTAWASKGEKDQRQLYIGAYQLQELRKMYAEKYNKLPKKKIDLTLALAHHPLNWLTGKEEDLIQEEILSSTGFNVNAYICGHTHNRDIINWYNNRRSMTTLVSGLGWPDGSTQHPYAHTYSSYVFNLDVNSIDVYVRSSDDAYSFQSDFRIYTNQIDRDNKKIVMPIDSCKTQAYFNLETVINRSPKACYITDSVLGEITDFVDIFLECELRMQDRLNNIKKNMQILFEKVNDKKFEEKLEIAKELELGKGGDNNSKLVQTFREELMEEFSNYLTSICTNVYKSICRIKKNAKIRTHLRYWQMGENEEDRYDQHSMYGNCFHDYTVRALQWGQLIKASYEKGSPLIGSVNAHYCKDSFDDNENKSEPDTKWTDFITIIPEFKENHYVRREESTQKILFRRPLLTFGVTIYQEEDREILYLMDFLRFDHFIGRQIIKFLECFPISIVEFIKYLKERKNADVRADHMDGR